MRELVPPAKRRDPLRAFLGRVPHFAAVPLLVLLLAITASGAASRSDQAGVDHSRFVTSYEGTETCLQCHEAEALDVFHSVHYQWRGEVAGLPEWEGQIAGKLGGINDFCTLPDINWIGLLTNTRGETVPGGCAQCHAGLGEKPATDPSPEQLANVDCLVCHAPADAYLRTVEKVDGALRLVPAPGVDVLALAQHPQAPADANCLSCHAHAGGGPNFKRGDLEPALASAARELDVHLAKDGAGLTCVDCHTTEAHRIAGKGVDLRTADPGVEVKTCESCHSQAPHQTAILNDHTERVACTTCHIPTFARATPTDMERDWSHAELVEAKGLYEPAIRFESNVRPVYAWYNGHAAAQPTDAPVRPDSRGIVSLFTPLGSIADPDAKIYPFKLHQALLPLDPASERLIPVKVGLFFQTGNSEKAVQVGYEEYFGQPYAGHEWVRAERYMGLYHEVVPKEQALSCVDCHGSEGALDFEALGYPGDPAAGR